MKIMFIASECWPLVKVGGLADVVGSLSRALKRKGVEVGVVLPFYRDINLRNGSFAKVDKVFTVNFSGKNQAFYVYKTLLFEEQVPVYLVKKKGFFEEKGVYLKPDASPKGSFLEAKKFFFLSRAGLEIARWQKADIIHCHDWQTGIVPFLVKEKGLPLKTLLTIHNLGYQGVYEAGMAVKILGKDFPGEEVNCLRLGIENADLINTVSPTYAEEILTPQFGCGLEKILRKRKKDLTGIVNGLDLNAWNPEKDPFIIKNYSPATLDQKKKNKIFLQKKYFKNADPRLPLISIVSRLAPQKGITLVKKIMPRLVKRNMNFILLGTGVEEYENYFTRLSQEHPGKIHAEITFSEKLAHRIYAGSDIFLIPSFYEPCGLGQQIAMRYGTPPVGRETGGIKDTVEDTGLGLFGRRAGTGFLFKRPTPRAFFGSIKKALSAYSKKDFWRDIQKKGMKKDFSWDRSAQKYVDLYQSLDRS